jgi:opacity protein-like surface antigen
MRHAKSVLLLTACMLFSVSLFAQEGHKPEFFLGYTNLQAQGLPDQNSVTGFGSNFFNNRTTLHGFGTEGTAYLWDALGLTGSFSFNENNLSDVTANETDSLKTDIFYFMGGPTLKIGHSSRLQPFARFLAGGAHVRFNATSELSTFGGNLTNSFSTGTTNFAFGAGGGLDLRVGDSMKVRLIQVDYAPVFLSNQSINILTQAGAIEPFALNGQRMDNVRFSFGIVF